MNWKFFSERRRISLETFLAGVASYDDAVSYFSKMGVSLPEDDQLKKFWATKKKKASKSVKPAPVAAPAVKNAEEDEDPKPKNVKHSHKKSSAREKKHDHDTKQ